MYGTVDLEHGAVAPWGALYFFRIKLFTVGENFIFINRICLSAVLYHSTGAMHLAMRKYSKTLLGVDHHK